MISFPSVVAYRSHIKQPKIILVEKDSWTSGMDTCLGNQLTEWKHNGRLSEVPKVILLSTSESDKTKCSYVDTVIMKPLRASTIAACLQQVLRMGVPQRKQLPNGSAFLHNLLAGKNILVVDDNKVNLRVAAGALKKYGANVACAESGKGALSLLQLPHKFDACFMDVQMPEMDGYAFLVCFILKKYSFFCLNLGCLHIYHLFFLNLLIVFYMLIL